MLKKNKQKDLFMWSPFRSAQTNNLMDALHVCVLGCGKQNELGNQMNTILFKFTLASVEKGPSWFLTAYVIFPMNTTSQVIYLLSKHNIAS